MNYYTSDLYLFCKSELKNGRFKERPFTTLEEMHSEIKHRWNSKITNADHVYILDDISMREHYDFLTAYMSQLNGNIHWIVGNHDTPDDPRMRKQFAEICPYKELTDNVGQKSYRLVLCHYPIYVWNGKHEEVIHLYGQTRDNFDDEMYQNAIAALNKSCKDFDGDKYIPFAAYNVGCMHWDYTPVSLKEILKVRR